MQDDWTSRFMRLALEVSTWSNMPSIKVGCVLVDERRRVIGLGYNTIPGGVDETEERLTNPAMRHHFVQHAEVNALVQCVGDARGGSAYVTHKPCANCTGVLIQAGIRKIFATVPTPELLDRFSDSYAVADLMLAEARVEFEIVG